MSKNFCQRISAKGFLSKDLCQRISVNWFLSKEPENQETFGSPSGQQLEKPSRHQKQFSPESKNHKRFDLNSIDWIATLLKEVLPSFQDKVCNSYISRDNQVQKKLNQIQKISKENQVQKISKDHPVWEKHQPTLIVTQLLCLVLFSHSLVYISDGNKNWQLIDFLTPVVHPGEELCKARQQGGRHQRGASEVERTYLVFIIMIKMILDPFSSPLMFSMMILMMKAADALTRGKVDL